MAITQAVRATYHDNSCASHKTLGGNEANDDAKGQPEVCQQEPIEKQSDSIELRPHEQIETGDQTHPYQGLDMEHEKSERIVP